MNYLDYVIIVFLLIGFILGFRDGLVRKLIGIIGLVLGLFLAYEFFNEVANILMPYLNNERQLALIVGWILIFLCTLVVFSIISWAIVFDKLRVFRRLRKESENFLRLFQMHKGLKDIFQASRQYSNNPFAAVFKEAYWLFSKEDRDNPNVAMTGSMEMLKEQRATPNHTPEDIARLFDSVASREVLKLEKHLVFLATTGSVSPFFGLFGTVWGVMSAFLAIGFTRCADLSVVAPGLAEALITTVAVLGAAISAGIAYN